MHKPLAQSVRLLLALAVTWAVLAGPAYGLAGAAAVWGLSASVLLCLLPGVVVLVLQSGPLAARQPVAGLLIGTGFRMAVVLAAVLLVRELWPALGPVVFIVWLVPVYLVALAVETRMAMASNREQLPAPSQPRQLRTTGPR